MLVLTRKPNESIRIGEDIVVTIVSVRGRRVQVGVSAPGAQVNREERTKPPRPRRNQ